MENGDVMTQVVAEGPLLGDGIHHVPVLFPLHGQVLAGQADGFGEHQAGDGAEVDFPQDDRPNQQNQTQAG